MAYQHQDLRTLADDRVNNPIRRSTLRSVNDLEVWSYVTDDPIGTVLGPNYFDNGFNQLTRDDIILVSADGGWGLIRIESVDRSAASVTISQHITGAGGSGAGGAVASVVGQIGTVSAAQLIAAIDAENDTNFLTDAERIAIANAVTSPATSSFDVGGNNIFNVGTVDGRDVNADGVNQDALQQLSGTIAGTTNYGTQFTGSTIPDGANNVAAFQSLETAVELALGSSSAVDLLSSWAPNTAYVANQEVTEGGALYRRIAAGTSAATFAADVANWEAIGASTSGAPNFQPGTAYQADALIAEGGSIYRRIAAGTSAGSFFADAANWELLDFRIPIVELTGGNTPLNEADHAHALIILRSGNNNLTWANAAETFPFEVWNLQGSPANVLGVSLENGGRTTGIVSGVDTHLAVPQLDIRPPVNKATLLTANNAVNTGKTPHLTQVFVPDLAGPGSPGVAVAMAGGADPLIAAGEWHHGYTGLPVTL